MFPQRKLFARMEPLPFNNSIHISKKAGNARWKLLAYRSFSCIQAMQNGEVDSSNFLWFKKDGS